MRSNVKKSWSSPELELGAEVLAELRAALESINESPAHPDSIAALNQAADALFKLRSDAEVSADGTRAADRASTAPKTD